VEKKLKYTFSKWKSVYFSFFNLKNLLSKQKKTQQVSGSVKKSSFKQGVAVPIPNNISIKQSLI
jgi:hypothetical protein